MFHQPLFISNITLLTADGVMGHTLRIRGERIVAIDDSPHRKDRVIDGNAGLVIPGLINAHDHLELNTFKRLKYRDVYTHSRQWIEDVEARFDRDPDITEPRRQPLTDRLLVGALKNLLSGVTTVCHHNPLHKPLRRNYPIRVVKNYGFCHSLFRGDDVRTSYKGTKPSQPWIIHLAEGVDAEAKAECDQLDRLGALQANTVLVHGVGLTSAQRLSFIDRGGGLIWCPGSNYFLLGQTACVQELAQAGKVALGSDSRLSGEFDLLSELRVAHQSGQLTPESLFESVTSKAACILRLPPDGPGQISEGGMADLVFLPPSTSTNPYASLLNLSRSQLDLVMLGGKPLVGSPRLQPVFEVTKTEFAPVLVDHVKKLMSQNVVTRLKKSTLQEPGLVLVT